MKCSNCGNEMYMTYHAPLVRRGQETRVLTVWECHNHCLRLQKSMSIPDYQEYVKQMEFAEEIARKLIAENPSLDPSLPEEGAENGEG